MKINIKRHFDYSCPLCKSSHWQIYQKFTGYQLLKCSHCGLIKTDILDKVDAPTNKIYESKEEVEKHFNLQKNEFQKYAKSIVDLFPIQTGSVLDIGCGFGWIVSEAKKRGYEAMGIDPSKKYTESGRKKLKVDLKTVSLEKFSTAQKYDVVVLNHVLEHIVSPNVFLQKVRKLINKNGYIVVACPNIDSLMFYLFKNRWYGLQPNQHIWQFTPNAMKILLEKNGFEIYNQTINSLGYNVSGLKQIFFKLIIKSANLLKRGDQLVLTGKNA